MPSTTACNRTASPSLTTCDTGAFTKFGAEYTVSIAGRLVTVFTSLLTTTSYLPAEPAFPTDPGTADFTSYELDVSPLMATPSFRHW